MQKQQLQTERLSGFCVNKRGEDSRTNKDWRHRYIKREEAVSSSEGGINDRSGWDKAWGRTHTHARAHTHTRGGGGWGGGTRNLRSVSSVNITSPPPAKANRLLKPLRKRSEWDRCEEKAVSCQHLDTPLPCASPSPPAAAFAPLHLPFLQLTATTLVVTEFVARTSGVSVYSGMETPLHWLWVGFLLPDRSSLRIMVSGRKTIIIHFARYLHFNFGHVFKIKCKHFLS